MDPVEDLDLPLFSDEDSTDDMELEHSNDELFANVDNIGMADMNKSLSPNAEPQFSPPDDETLGPGILPEMPWNDTTKVVERWLQMYQVC